MNWIFVALIVIATLTGAFNGTMPAVQQACIDSAQRAVELSIGLIGQMTLWLGLVGVLRQAGMLKSLASVLRPVTTRLFPEVPPDHPAMSAMVMNFAANMLGLGNAATPFGLKAMQELDTLNKHKGVASNSMALFLTINVAGFALLPITVIGLRAKLGSHDPASMMIPTMIATAVSTVCAVLVCKALQGWNRFAPEGYETTGPAAVVAAPTLDTAQLQKAEELAAIAPQARWTRRLLAWSIILAFVGAAVLHVRNFKAPETDLTLTASRDLASNWVLPLLILGMVTIGLGRQVKVYEAFLASAKEGFQTAISVIPFLVGILVCIGMFRASGAMGVVVGWIAPLLEPIGFPAEALPIVLIRPFSGGGATGLMTDVIKTHGADSFLGQLVSVLAGSSETTFYVIAVYCGVAQVKTLRHSLISCLVTDFVGPIAGFLACLWFFSGAK